MALPQSVIRHPNSCKHDLSGKCALAELLYNDTNHSPVAIVDDLLHGLLKFDLALLVDHGKFAGDTVVDKLFHSLAEDIRRPDALLAGIGIGDKLN